MKSIRLGCTDFDSTTLKKFLLHRKELEKQHLAKNVFCNATHGGVLGISQFKEHLQWDSYSQSSVWTLSSLRLVCDCQRRSGSCSFTAMALLQGGVGRVRCAFSSRDPLLTFFCRTSFLFPRFASPATLSAFACATVHVWFLLPRRGPDSKSLCIAESTFRRWSFCISSTDRPLFHPERLPAAFLAFPVELLRTF